MVDYIRVHDIQTFRVTLGDTGLGHGVGFRGPACWITLENMIYRPLG